MSISNKIEDLTKLTHRNFDVAIIGAGCAGLSLANQLSLNTNKSIVIIDEQTQRPNHLWGFWDNGNESFEIARKVSQKTWDKWSVHSHEKKTTHEGKQSVYRVLESEIFEKFIWRELLKNKKIERIKSNVNNCAKTPLKTTLHLINGQEITANRIFDSRPLQYPRGVLLQHFVGLKIQTNQKIFDPSTLILMDFRATQKEGIHFIYLLPFCEKSALIESTVISESPKENTWYQKQIRKYLTKFYNCSYFTIQNTEQGIIPMGVPQSDISMGIPIGLRAGALRASSGYAFAQIQDQVWDLGQKICKNIPPITKPGCDKFEQFMDSVFLRVMKRHPENAPDIFLKILDSLNGDEFADFMRGYSKWRIKLRLIMNLPKVKFLKGIIN